MVEGTGAVMPEWERAFSGNPEDVPAARWFLLRTIEGWPVDTDLVALVGTELVTNAVVHAPGQFTVTIRHADGRVAIGVSDRNPARPTIEPANDQTPSGRGMAIVDGLVEHWEVDAHPWGKTVWAHFPRWTDSSAMVDNGHAEGHTRPGESLP